MFIDIHCHCHESRHPLIKRRNNTCWPNPQQMIGMMDEAGIDKAVLLGSVSPEWRWTTVNPEEVLRIYNQYPDRFIPFCNFDPRYLTNDTNANFRPLLQAYKEMGFKGVGEYYPNIPFDDPLNMNFFEQVQEYDFPLTFHIAPKIGGCYGLYDELGLPRLEKVLKSFPDLIFLAHSQCFWAEISSDVTEETRNSYPKGKVNPGKVVELMNKYPNLHGDLSAGSGFNAISRDPEFGCWFLEEFQDRLYFGTDIANYPQELPMMDYYHKLDNENMIPKEVFDKVTHKNAIKLLGLSLNIL